MLRLQLRVPEIAIKLIYAQRRSVELCRELVALTAWQRQRLQWITWFATVRGMDVAMVMVMAVDVWAVATEAYESDCPHRQGRRRKPKRATASIARDDTDGLRRGVRGRATFAGLSVIALAGALRLHALRRAVNHVIR